MLRNKALDLLEIINRGATEWFGLGKPSRISKSIPPALPYSPLNLCPQVPPLRVFQKPPGMGTLCKSHSEALQKHKLTEICSILCQELSSPNPLNHRTWTAPPQNSLMFYVGRSVPVKISFPYTMARGKITEWSLFGVGSAHRKFPDGWGAIPTQVEWIQSNTLRMSSVCRTG